jgi:hypothetical protein
MTIKYDDRSQNGKGKNTYLMTVVTMQWSANVCPNFITTKGKKMKKLK